MSDDLIFKLFNELSMLSMNCWLAWYCFCHMKHGHKHRHRTLIPIIV